MKLLIFKKFLKKKEIYSPPRRSQTSLHLQPSRGLPAPPDRLRLTGINREFDQHSEADGQNWSSRNSRASRISNSSKNYTVSFLFDAQTDRIFNKAVLVDKICASIPLQRNHFRQRSETESRAFPLVYTQVISPNESVTENSQNLPWEAFLRRRDVTACPIHFYLKTCKYSTQTNFKQPNMELKSIQRTQYVTVLQTCKDLKS